MNITKEFKKIGRLSIIIKSNHWSCEEDVYTQIDLLEKYDFPAKVIVLEAWSDEATFYVWNGDKKWENKDKLMKAIRQAGLHLVLWQIPVLKKQGSDEIISNKLEKDRCEAIEKGLIVKNADGSPYEIPKGNWFEGSMIPDFTNEETCQSWFSKRRYLIDMGVCGFKTDGGEFIYDENVRFYDKRTGKEGVNKYAIDYTKAYQDFMKGYAKESRILFSRAGYAGVHNHTILWAGDHFSTNDEFKNIISAGLSCGLSGIIFWGFDIGGFAGELPTLDLYRRSTAMACFCPIMQYHSEPDGGQFKEIFENKDTNNERSPWNLAKAYNSPRFIDEMRYWYKLRERLLPYIIATAKDCVKNYKPMMRALIYDFFDDKEVLDIEDEYMFGEDLLVAPIIEENATSREVYLPKGKWWDFFTKEEYEGRQKVIIARNDIAVFTRNVSVLKYIL